MAEQELINQLDKSIDAIIARRATDLSTTGEETLDRLAALAVELCSMPRESFKSELREELRRSATMTTTSATTGKEAQQSPRTVRQTITPYLTVERAEQLVDFIKSAFEGVEIFRTIGSAGGLHAEVVIGDSKLMIGGYEGVEEMPTALHLYVPDADAVYQRALAAGGTSIEEPVDQFYGDREAGIKDPTGNIWWIATHQEGPAGSFIPEGMRQVMLFLHTVGASALIDFLSQAFGAEEVSRYQSPEGVIQHAVVRIGDSLIEMGEAHGEAQPMPPALFLEVENLEEAYQRALSVGATSLQPPNEQSYGRTAWVKDAWGSVWYLAQGSDQ